MEMPGLSTRKKNKNAHPAVNAGVAPKPRRTTAQMKQSREEDAQTKKKKEAAEKAAVKAVVAIEDEQHRDDAIRADNANHPVDWRSPPPASPRKIPTREMSPEDKEEEPLDDVPVLGDGLDNFVPAEGDSSEEEDETSEDEELAKPKKVPKPKRADVTASRSTQDATGTPATSAATGTKRKAMDSKMSKPRKKSKNKVQKKSGLATPKSGLSSGVEADDNESGVKFGGPAIDDDVDEKLERQEQDSEKKKRGLPTAPIIQIAPTPARPLTKKEQRNNAKKWALAHLPAGTDSLFTNELVPLARELLGTLPPWSSLTADHVQGLVNRVYGTKKDKPIHKVSADGIWCGMLAYRLSDWRAGIGAQGMKAVQTLFDTAQEDESESEAEEESTEQVPLDAQPSKPAKFSFKTPEGIAAFVEWALQKHKESGTLAFYWQTWGDGKEKKGLFLSHLVAYTYAYHLTALAALPTKHTHSDAPAIGAVQRSLQFWKTGMLVIPCKNEGHFSIDNWGDISTQGSDGKIKKIRRATFFCATLATWDDGRWQQLRAAADEWVEKKKQAITSSRATSEAEDLVEEEEDVIIVSD
ncbi:hypothetical protein B0H10DRAFT_2243012 [Mycena sp. CBHHK59/15]|nr:hypothetical protein B0H10DRAFT_2243012 [Mycena sp. CBHHK59/15]